MSSDTSTEVSAAPPSTPTLREVVVNAEKIVQASRTFYSKLNGDLGDPVLDEEEREALALILQQFPTTFHALKSRATEQMDMLAKSLKAAGDREEEWSRMTSLFGQYKEKVTKDISLAGELTTKLEEENQLLKKENEFLHAKVEEILDKTSAGVAGQLVEKYAGSFGDLFRILGQAQYSSDSSQTQIE
eukprot:TRINITY_DN984_c0_g2_i2.p1 TRINITY_DN984_c0_g2~~TRINITY_DN984_c0_g2_i2.p1  ORF type:complete len:188 (-),score=65.05 TRINITY_DN984_c0_g2_i2:15-578(-)